MTRWVPIDYRDFWDVPRIFFAAAGGDLFLFDCPFDEEVEDFPNDYRVHRMPPLTPDDRAGSWAELHRKAVRELGTVPVTAVTFDPTKRKFIDGAILDEVAGAAVAHRPAG
ncbi:MAG: hypothetical protein K2X82_18640 [Gemmataceae bacterium]|nr:hypothetical protein [Gemmataceae bacterium]